MNLETGNKQNGSKSTNHESQTMSFWTRAGKQNFPRGPLSWLTEQKNPVKIQSKHYLQFFAIKKTLTYNVDEKIHFIWKKCIQIKNRIR